MQWRLAIELPETADTSSWLYVFLFCTVVERWMSTVYMCIIYRLRLHGIQNTWLRKELSFVITNYDIASHKWIILEFTAGITYALHSFIIPTLSLFRPTPFHPLLQITLKLLRVSYNFELSQHDQKEQIWWFLTDILPLETQWKLTVERLVNKFTELWIFHPVPSHFNTLYSHPHHFFNNLKVWTSSFS